MKSIWVAVVASAVLVLGATGCGTTGSSSGAGLQGDDPCNVAVGAVVGGVIGALAGSKHRGRNAAIGAGLGALACVVINAVSRQTKTADQVETDYRKQHGQLPPSEPVVEAYSVVVNPDNQVRGGEKIQVVSNMTVVRGANRPINDVKEVLTLSGAGGTKTLEKSAAGQPGSGAYENTFNLSFPKDVEPGSYPVTTQLLVNGKPAAEKKQKLVVVAIGEMRQFTLVSR